MTPAHRSAEDVAREIAEQTNEHAGCGEHCTFVPAVAEVIEAYVQQRIQAELQACAAVRCLWCAGTDPLLQLRPYRYPSGWRHLPVDSTCGDAGQRCSESELWRARGGQQ